MDYRVILIEIENNFRYLFPKGTGNFWDSQKRSYRKDKNANLQVVREDGTLTGTVESIYFEGVSAPLTSTLTETEITKQVFKEAHSRVFAEPERSFLDWLLRRN